MEPALITVHFEKKALRFEETTPIGCAIKMTAWKGEQSCANPRNDSPDVDYLSN
jgi:hypothetical protein